MVNPATPPLVGASAWRRMFTGLHFWLSYWSSARFYGKKNDRSCFLLRIMSPAIFTQTVEVRWSDLTPTSTCATAPMLTYAPTPGLAGIGAIWLCWWRIRPSGLTWGRCCFRTALTIFRGSAPGRSAQDMTIDIRLEAASPGLWRCRWSFTPPPATDMQRLNWWDGPSGCHRHHRGGRPGWIWPPANSLCRLPCWLSFAALTQVDFHPRCRNRTGRSAGASRAARLACGFMVAKQTAETIQTYTWMTIATALTALIDGRANAARAKTGALLVSIHERPPGKGRLVPGWEAGRANRCRCQASGGAFGLTALSLH